MARLLPFLWYARDAEEAARFYASILPDSRVDSVHILPGDSPSGPEGSVNVVNFTLLGQPMQAMTAGPHQDFNDAISLMIEVDTQEELDRFWKALGEGGKFVACGWLQDRYGLRWQITPRQLPELMTTGDLAARRRVAAAMMQMVKLDIAALQAAHAGE